MLLVGNETLSSEGKLFIQLFVYTFYIILKFLNIKEEINLGTFNST